MHHAWTMFHILPATVCGVAFIRNVRKAAAEKRRQEGRICPGKSDLARHVFTATICLASMIVSVAAVVLELPQ